MTVCALRVWPRTGQSIGGGAQASITANKPLVATTFLVLVDYQSSLLLAYKSHI